MGFTHVELLPVHEHPFDGSWGYQPIGLFAPTSRFGTPEDFADFVDRAHAAGLGVIVDWVPGHFPTDAHGLAYFDGTHLYEHADPRKGLQPDWNTLIYNFGRREVANFLIDSALFWLETFPRRRLARRCRRLDAVPRLQPRSRRMDSQRVRRKREPRGDRVFARVQRHVVRGAARHCDDRRGIDAWPQRFAADVGGGLGFGYKWNMGWMHDTLDYFAEDPIYRKYHHDKMTFGLMYAFSENFVLPLSHDEVVHGKRSLLGKMPGDDWQRFAELARATTASCTRIPERSCCSWAASSHRNASGITTAASTGICSTIRATRRAARSYAT